MKKEYLKIFIVDDDIFCASIYEQYLKIHNYKDIKYFSCGQDCLDELHNKPNIIILDYNMNEMDGFEVLKKIKRYDPNMYVIMVSGQDSVNKAVNTLKYGAFDYLEKGSNTCEKIVNVLKKILELEKEISQIKSKDFPKFFSTYLSKLIKRIIISSIFMFLLISCKTYNVLEEQQLLKNIEDFRFDPEYQYKIRKDDKITLSVWGEQDLSVGSVYGIYSSNEVYGKWLLVDNNGNIEVPKLGTTYVIGKTIPDLKEEIKKKLKKWLVNPIVDIKVLNKEITVLGEVRTPDVIQVDKDQNTLLEIISKAGGFELYANLKFIKILRQEDENVSVTNIDLTKMKDVLSQNITLHPGDYIIIPSKKSKDIEKRISTVIPFSTIATATAVLIGQF